MPAKKIKIKDLSSSSYDTVNDNTARAKCMCTHLPARVLLAAGRELGLPVDDAAHAAVDVDRGRRDLGGGRDERDQFGVAAEEDT